LGLCVSADAAAVLAALDERGLRRTLDAALAALLDVLSLAIGFISFLPDQAHNLLQRPNVFSHARLHCWCDAKGLMNPTERENTSYKENLSENTF